MRVKRINVAILNHIDTRLSRISLDIMRQSMRFFEQKYAIFVALVSNIW